MLPPAPVVFSMITGWPRDAFIRWPRTRATVSVGPPVANATLIVTGRVGYPCAHTLDDTAVSVAMTAAPRSNDWWRRKMAIGVSIIFPPDQDRALMQLGRPSWIGKVDHGLSLWTMKFAWNLLEGCLKC